MHRIKRQIKKSGRTMRWLAAQLGISETYFRDVASGYRVPARHHQAGLACLLDCHVNDLWPPGKSK